MIDELDLQFLLDREASQPNKTMLSDAIENKSILVTGGGGSIGSELCRTVCKYRPYRLKIYESSELALYRIKEELSKKYPKINVQYILGSITNANGINRAMINVDAVYHAAAYKHVPLVEENPVEGVLNNVYGTLLTAEAAIEKSVESFVLISTDKAVNPTSVMGATKRAAEKIVQSLNGQGTKLSAVRFGNVLGSSGSVIPKFLQQIALGGPVTITDKEMTRYFMSIPEAVALTIQAGEIAEGGEVFFLDMGQPIKIYDIARALIEVQGLRVNKDIEIIETGIRPGEKLHESLHEGTYKETTVNGIFKADTKPNSWQRIHEPVEVIIGHALGWQLWEVRRYP